MMRLGAMLRHRRAVSTLASALLLIATAAGCSSHASTATARAST